VSGRNFDPYAYIISKNIHRNRRPSEFFEFESMGMRFTASLSRFPDGRLAELFLDNHKAGSAIGTLVRDAAIIQHGADPEVIRRALCRDSQGNASGPLAKALDLVLGSSGNGV
jgi:hypothetical protein